MKKSRESVRCQKSPSAWHAQFEVLMPAIVAHAKIAFRHLDPEAREEAVQEVVCNACCAFARLVELGKASLAYPTPLARYGVAQFLDGRKVGSRLNSKDVLSTYCQRKNHLRVERLDHHDSQDDAWAEVLVEDRRAGPAATAAVRIDFSNWLHLLPRRLRKMATFLATGETTTAAAERFGVSQGRLSQVRRQLHDAWSRFQGDLLTPAMA